MAAAGPDKKLCGAKTKTGTCRNVAGKGTNHLGVGRCSRHGGSTKNHVKAASREIVHRAVVDLGLEIDTTPEEALLEEVKRTAHNVMRFGMLFNELSDHPESDEYVPPDGNGKGHWQRGQPGIYGRLYHESGMPSGRLEPHVLYAMWLEERKQLKAVSEAALRAGVDERRVRIAEADATRLLEAFRVSLVAMGLEDRLEEFRGHFVDALKHIIEPASRDALAAGQSG